MPSPQEKPWWEDLSQWDTHGSSTGIEYQMALEMETKRCLHKVSHIIERLISEAEEHAVKRERERIVGMIEAEKERDRLAYTQAIKRQRDDQLMAESIKDEWNGVCSVHDFYLEKLSEPLTPKDETSE